LGIQSELSGGYLKQFICIQTSSKTTNKHLAVKCYACVKLLSNNTRDFILTFGINMSMQAADIFPDRELTVS
jgi:hypothetical protein